MTSRSARASKLTHAFMCCALALVGCRDSGPRGEELDPETMTELKSTVARDTSYVVLARQSAKLDNRVIVRSGIVGVSEGVGTYPPSGHGCIVGSDKSNCYIGRTEHGLLLDEVNFGATTTSRFVSDTVRVTGSANVPELFYRSALSTTGTPTITTPHVLTAAFFPVFPVLPSMETAEPSSDSEGNAGSAVFIGADTCLGAGDYPSLTIGDGVRLTFSASCAGTPSATAVHVRDITVTRWATFEVDDIEVHARDVISTLYGSHVLLRSASFHARDIDITHSVDVQISAGTYHARDFKADLVTHPDDELAKVLVARRLEVASALATNGGIRMRFYVSGGDGTSSTAVPVAPYAAKIGTITGVSVLALAGAGTPGGTIEVTADSYVWGSLFADHVLVGARTELHLPTDPVPANAPFPEPPAADTDNDSVANGSDNCPGEPNPTQADGDSDGYGDACDNCQSAANPRQEIDPPSTLGRACTMPPGAFCGNGVVDAGNSEECDDGALNNGPTHACGRLCAYTSRPPVITSQPQNRIVFIGESATFSVTATSEDGAADLTYQWFRNGVAISGATGTSVTLPAVGTTDHGTQIHVVVANGAVTRTSESASLHVRAVYASGTGTAESPYVIDDCTRLQGMRDDLSAHYVISNDIDCAGFQGSYEGLGFVPVGATGPFSGTLDGAGHVVRNLQIARSTEEGNVGLFASASSAVIHDLGLEAVSIGGGGLMGGLVGQGTDVELSRVFVTGNIAGLAYTGGLAGKLRQSRVSDAYARVTINRSESPIPDPAVGSLIGEDVDGVYTRVYSAGNVVPALGGAFGKETQTARRSVLIDCTVSGQPCTGSAKTTTALEVPSTYLREAPPWNFSSVWGFKSTSGSLTGYPCLRFEAGCGVEPICGDGSLMQWPGSAPELCDDGNNIDGDGCSATCVPSAIIVDVAPALEYRAAALSARTSAAMDGSGLVLFVGTRDYFSSAEIYARRASGAGVFIDSAPFRIDADLPTVASTKPVVVGLPTGGFVVAWSARRAGTLDVVARLVREDGTLGREVLINSQRSGTQDGAAITLAGDSVVIAWTTHVHTADDPLSGVRARRFDFALSPLSAEIALASSRQDFELDVTLASAGSMWGAVWVRRTAEEALPELAMRRFIGNAPLDRDDISLFDGAPFDQPQLATARHPDDGQYRFAVIVRSTSLDAFGDIFLGIVSADGVSEGAFPLGSVSGVDEHLPTLGVGTTFADLVMAYSYGTPTRARTMAFNSPPSLAPLNALLEAGVESTPTILATPTGYWISWTGMLAGMPDQGFLAFFVSLKNQPARMCHSTEPCGGPNAAKLLYDWDARELVSESGGLVTEWRDRVSRIAFKFPAGDRPFRRSVDRNFGNRPSIQFSGGEVGTTSAVVPMPDTATWVFVTKNVGTGFNVLFEGGEPHFQAESSTPLIYHEGSRWFASFSAPAGTAGVYSWNTHSPTVMVVPIDPRTSTNPLLGTYINGVFDSIAWTGGYPTTIADRTWRLGGRPFSSAYWQGSVARVRVYATALTAGEEAAENAWLEEEYGLEAPVPPSGLCADGAPCGGPNAAKLLYDWDATSLVSESAGAVTEWTDRVGGRATFVFPEGQRPVRNALDPMFGDHPSLELTGAEFGESEVDVPLPDTATWVLVAERKGSGVRVLLEGGDPNFQASPGAPLFYSDSTIWYANLSGSSSSGGRYVNDDHSPVVMVAPFDARTGGVPISALYLNGRSVGTAFGSLSPTVLDDRRWHVGGRRIEGQHWTGALARIRVYESALSPTEAAAETAWLQSEYGLDAPEPSPDLMCVDGTPCGGPNAAKLMYDWDARVLVTEASGVVTRWTDRVSGRISFEFPSGQRPTRNVADATLNGQPSLEFSGTQYGATDGDVPLPATATWAFVAEQAGSGIRVLFEGGDPHYLASPGAPVVYLHDTTWYANISAQGLIGGRLSTSYPTSFVMVVPFDPSSSLNPVPAWYINGVSSGTSWGSFASSALDARRWHIGGRRLEAQGWSGSIARIRVYSSAFSASEAAAEDAWLRGEYGL